MERELKFRAWDKEEKKFENYFQINCNGVLATFDPIIAEWGKAKDGRYILTQYTGMKTAKGYEVYEGDILENDTDWFKVVFSEGKFECEPIRGGNVYFALEEITSSSETNHCGNIYENPELLEKVCETCGGTGEVTTMEAVYPNEPHMAPIGSAPCPDCSSRGDDDYDNQE